MHFLPGAPLTASSGALIFVPQTGFIGMSFNYIFSNQQEEMSPLLTSLREILYLKHQPANLAYQETLHPLH